MINKWLQTMLTPAKRAVSMWRDLADAIEFALVERVGKVEQTLIENQSLLTMSKEELDKKQAELGMFFSVIDVPKDEQGLALVHRLDQIHLKATEFPVKDMVRRSFNDLDMDWQPLYAPIDQVSEPYGTRFIDSELWSSLSSSEQDLYFLTSRGRMVLNLNQFMPPREELDRIYNSIRDTIVPLLPLDIVFDGFFTQVKMSASFTFIESNTHTALIYDEFSLVHSISIATEVSTVLDISFTIFQDQYSVDSPTRSVRENFDNRLVPLLGELHLSAMPLAAPYNLYELRTIHPDPSIGAKRIDGNNWVSTGEAVPPKGLSFPVQSIGDRTIYHAIPCSLGKRYIVSATKHGESDVKIYLSRSNTVSGAVLDLISESSLVGTYSEVFTPASITMYIILVAPINGSGAISNISVNELIEI